MKRAALIFLLLAVVVTGAVLLVLRGELFAAPPEIVELPVATLSPSAVSPNVPTFVTISVNFPDPAIKSPRLQYLDPANGKWKTIVALKDKGKFPDEVAEDRSFSGRLRLLNSGSLIDIALKRGAVLKVKASVPFPPTLRLSARKKGTTGILVSPTFTIEEINSTSLSIPTGVSSGSPVSITAPTSFIFDDTDPSRLVLRKLGVEGYEIRVTVDQNPSSLPLEAWIFENVLGFGSSPGAPTSFAEYPEALVETINVAGLPGIKMTTVDLQTQVSIFLHDTSNSRVIRFEILTPSDLGQDTRLIENIPEVLTIVNSIQF